MFTIGRKAAARHHHSMIREVLKYAVLVLLVVVIFATAKWLNRWENKEYTISSGKPGAGYHLFASKLVELGEKPSIALSFKEVESEGRVENLQRLGRGEVDFALVQQGEALSKDVRVVAEVYREIVHIVVRKDAGVNSFSDLKGKRLSIGLAGSGTQIVSHQLLEHYRLSEGVMTLHELSPQESVDGVLKGELDGFILATALRAPVIEKAMASGLVRHVSMGAADDLASSAHGISSRYRHLQPTVIAKHAFGCGEKSDEVLPKKAITVLSIPSFLVCHEQVHESAVHAVTKAIYDNRYAFDKELAMGSLREPKDLEAFVYPLHEGADKYYRRKDPGFLIVHAEVIAMLLSVMIALVGIVSAVRRWVALRQKNRIDVYYAAVNSIWKRLKSESITELKKEEQALVELRYKAFDELIDERLTADESFRIFQDLLEQCLQELERQRKKKSNAEKSGR